MTMTMEAAEAIVSQSIDSKPESAFEERDEDSEPIDSDSEPDSPIENDDEEDADGADDAIPEGDSNADLHALLAYSKSRLQKQADQEAADPPPEDEPAVITDDDEIEDSRDCAAEEAVADYSAVQRTKSEEEQYLMAVAKAKMAEAEAKAAADDDEMEALRQEARLQNNNNNSEVTEKDLMAVAKAKMAEAEAKAAADDDEMEALREEARQRAKPQAEENIDSTEDAEEDPAHLLKLAEMKVKRAEEMARKDEEATGVNVIKPVAAPTRRSDANSELWALLNYSKMRIETGSTPQMGKKASSTRGDDVSVSSKGTKISLSSKASRKSVGSDSIGPVSVVAAPGDNNLKTDENAHGKAEKEGIPFPDVTGADASVEGSVSGDEQESLSDEQDSISDETDEDDEEDELPSFLRDDDAEEEIDPAEAKRLYEEAKFKAASILSVDEDLNDVQMLQAMAIAVEAANKGEEKFSTRRSLYRLSDAKMEDLKSFLDFSKLNLSSLSDEKATPQNNEREKVGWGIGRGRLFKKLGAAFQDLKERCDEIDQRKQQERKGQLSNTEMFHAAFDDLKKQIDEYEKIVKSKK